MSWDLGLLFRAESSLVPAHSLMILHLVCNLLYFRVKELLMKHLFLHWQTVVVELRKKILRVDIPVAVLTPPSLKSSTGWGLQCDTQIFLQGHGVKLDQGPQRSINRQNLYLNAPAVGPSIVGHSLEPVRELVVQWHITMRHRYQLYISSAAFASISHSSNLPIFVGHCMYESWIFFFIL